MDEEGLADRHFDLADFGLEFPRHAGDVRVEADADFPLQFFLGRLGRDLRHAAKTGGAAEPVVERHRRERSAHHEGDENG